MSTVYIGIYTPCPEKEYSILGITLTNLDSFIFDKNYPDTSGSLENSLHRCNIVTWRWRHIWRHQKRRLQTKTDIKNFPKRKKHDTANQLLKEFANRHWSRWLNQRWKKSTNLVLFGSGRCPVWSCRHCSVASRSGNISTCFKGGVTHCKHWFTHTYVYCNKYNKNEW